MDDAAPPLQFINISNPQDQTTFEAQAARGAVVFHIARLRGRKRRILDSDARVEYEPNKIIRSFHVWRNGRAPFRKQKAVATDAFEVNPPPDSGNVAESDSAVVPVSQQAGDTPSSKQRLNTQVWDTGASVELSKAGSGDPEKAYRGFRSSASTSWPLYLRSSSACLGRKAHPHSLLHPLSHGNSDPFSALALS